MYVVHISQSMIKHPQQFGVSVLKAQMREAALREELKKLTFSENSAKNSERIKKISRELRLLRQDLILKMTLLKQLMSAE